MKKETLEKYEMFKEKLERMQQCPQDPAVSVVIEGVVILDRDILKDVYHLVINRVQDQMKKIQKDMQWDS